MISWNTHCFSRVLCACSVVPGSLWSWSGTTPEGSAWCCWRWTPRNSESALVWVLSPPLWGDCTRVEEAQTHMKAFIVKKLLFTTISTVNWTQHFYLLLASESSLSKRDRRVWAPMFRGSVCDLTSSRRLSPTCPKDLSLLASLSLRDGSTGGLDHAKQIFPPQTCHLSLTFQAAEAPSRSQT